MVRYTVFTGFDDKPMAIFRLKLTYKDLEYRVDDGNVIYPNIDNKNVDIKNSLYLAEPNAAENIALSHMFPLEKDELLTDKELIRYLFEEEVNG